MKRSPRRLRVKIIFGVVTSVFSFALFLSIAQLVEGDVLHLDTVLSYLTYSHRTPEMTQLMRVITFLGGSFTLIATLSATLLLWRTKKNHEAHFFLTTIVLGFALNTALKYFYKIPRPAIDPVYSELFYSFPSGHSMNAFIFYSLGTYMVFHITRNKIHTLYAGVVSGLLIVLIGFSRVYLGVHYPSDVLAGYIMGLWLVSTMILADTLLHSKKIEWITSVD